MNEPTATSQTVIIALALLTFLTTALKFVYDWEVQKRDRAWKVQDEERKTMIALKVEEAAAQAKSDLDQQTSHVARKVEEAATTVKQDLRQQTARVEQAADRAYTEANRLNQKLERVTAQFDATLQSNLQQQEVKTKLADMETTELDTNTRVRGLEEKIE